MQENQRTVSNITLENQITVSFCENVNVLNLENSIKIL